MHAEQEQLEGPVKEAARRQAAKHRAGATLAVEQRDKREVIRAPGKL